MQIWSVWKKAPKNLEIGTSNLEISKYVSNKTKDADYFFMVFFTLLMVSVVLPCCSFGSNETKGFCFTIQADRTASSKVSML